MGVPGPSGYATDGEAPMTEAGQKVGVLLSGGGDNGGGV